MHPNQAFRKTSREANIEFARQRSFGVLSVNSEPAPLISHVPFQLSENGKYLEAHLVRSNPIVRLLEQPIAAVVAVSGADAYISPDWYGVDNQVPTWNYVAVHLRGELRLLDASCLQGILENLSANMEQRLLPKTPWTLGKLDDAVFTSLVKQIAKMGGDISTFVPDTVNTAVLEALKTK